MPGRESRDLARYRDLLQHALRSVCISSREALLLCDALHDTLIDASTARQLHHEVLSATRHSQLEERYSVDIAAFTARLCSYTDMQRMAIVDAIEKACEGNDGTLETRLMATGLLAGKKSDPGLDSVDLIEKINEWIAHINDTYAPDQRRGMRPDNMQLEVSEGIAPNMLVFVGDKWAWWDEEQKAWFPVHWPDLARKHPLLPSQAAQRVSQICRQEFSKVLKAFTSSGCAYFLPKAQYSLPDGTVLTARWDGEAQWWFDLTDADETVVTIDSGSGILCAELRSELGMSSRRKWHNGMFSYTDLRFVDRL